MICPYYTRAATGDYRCMAATPAGHCGNPEKTCPIKQEKPEERNVDYVW